MIQDLLSRVLRQLMWRGFGKVRNIRTLVILVLVLAGVLKLIPTDDGGPVPDRIEGHPQLTDGDSFRLGKFDVRMVGIDAPEGRQMCQLNGRPWACGTEAMKRLRGQTRQGSFSCKSEKRDQYDRVLATCFVGDRNINQWMVQNGWAVAYGRRYQREERAAKMAKRGIWKSTFQRPRQWRDENNR